jgi:hypothetical protein
MKKEKKKEDSSGEPKTNTNQTADNPILQISQTLGVPQQLIQSFLPVIDKYLDQKINEKFKQLMEEERPKIVNGLKNALAEMLDKVGVPPNPNPETPANPSNPETSANPTLNPQILQLMASFLGGGSGKSELDKIADVVTKARMISDALNPPTVWDKVFPQIVVRAFMKSGLLTEKEGEEVIKAAQGETKT